MSHENGASTEHSASLARPKPKDLREFSLRAILCGLFVAALKPIGGLIPKRNDFSKRFEPVTLCIGFADLLI